ncbi:MAG: hypothetical protein EBZ47_00040 [Chlamydiae bacterium]|nr:hypothetical protein [Chlamydiota bacterium]
MKSYPIYAVTLLVIFSLASCQKNLSPTDSPAAIAAIAPSKVSIPPPVNTEKQVKPPRPKVVQL